MRGIEKWMERGPLQDFARQPSYSWKAQFRCTLDRAFRMTRALPRGRASIREDQMKRQRGRNRRSSGGQNHNINRHFESNGPDVKIRGSAQQVLDKYLQYAREAQTNGDRVKSEAYFQHAEHYQRTLAMMQAAQKPKRDRDDNRGREQDNDDDEAELEESAEESQADAEDRNGSSDRSDPLRVIGDEDTGKAEDARSEADTADDTAEKPKRPKRRNYRKKSDEEAASGASEAGVPDEADGVMKTLSRGRRSGRTSNKDDSADEAPETAAAE